MPFWGLFRSEQVFSRAKEYLPERWLPGQEPAAAATATPGQEQPAGVCPATGADASSAHSSSGCPFLRARARMAGGGQGAAAAAAGSGIAAAPGSRLAAALGRLGAAASAATGLDRFAQPQAPGELPALGLHSGAAGAEQAPGEAGLQGNHEYAFMPFGVGARSCPGRALAMLELRVFLVKLLSQYSLAPGPGTRAIEETKVMNSGRGVSLAFRRRQGGGA
jgi:hypothetical protein